MPIDEATLAELYERIDALERRVDQLANQVGVPGGSATQAHPPAATLVALARSGDPDDLRAAIEGYMRQEGVDQATAQLAIRDVM
ncbi:hypothetical protein B7486_60640 [cyanobacterium TDX16]|nr:hypothetical protein B7486_60640 [cyanobacterium TDX16]